uniref:Integrase catalytic domain-containing protein n=1 Tax=Triatoma infestans TaxID=30076 RepID=A0A023F1Q9_TRIIF
MSIKEAIVNELHKPARVRYPRRRILLKGIDDLWQLDLIEMIPYARENNGYKYILTVIDCFSKYAWVKPVKSKTGQDVAKAMETIFKSSGRVPNNIQTDNGKEFYNAIFNKLMKLYNINHYSTYSQIKSSIVERFNRTFKSMLYRRFSLQGSYKYIKQLSDLIQNYNNKVHRTIGMKPSEVNKNNESSILTTVYSAIDGRRKEKQRFKEGDYVRISKNRTVFDKGYTPNWSAEIFKIKTVRKTTPYTYLLQDMTGQLIQGAFYNEELQKARYKNVYLVEKIKKRKDNKVLVQWLGFSKPSWINKNNLIN